MHLTPSHARFLAAVRIVSFLSAVSCRYVCCYCYWGKKSQCWRPDNYKWGLYTQYCSYIRYIAAVFCVIGTCLAGRALCKAVSWQVCFPFIIKSWQEFSIGISLKKIHCGFAPIWWESSSFLLKIQRQDRWLAYGGFYYLSFSQSMQMTVY